MAKPTNKRTKILLAFLIGLLIVAYRLIFAPPSPAEDELAFDANTVAIDRVENILNQIETINFDSDLTNDSTFRSLKSIETPLISLPIGRENPFSAN